MGQSLSNPEPINIPQVAPPAKPSAVPLSPFVTLGAGCYWGTDKFVRKDFVKRFPGSVKSVSVGFMSPDPKHPKNPSYRAVCSGTTGHVEVAHIELSDPAAHYEELIRFFFMFHDPTTKNRQGNDVGTQYHSYIFTHDSEQEKIAKRVHRQVQDAVSRGTLNCYSQTDVRTSIGPATVYYEAHKEHQDYLANNPNGYCNHFFRFKEFPLV